MIIAISDFKRKSEFFQSYAKNEIGFLFRETALSINHPRGELCSPQPHSAAYGTLYIFCFVADIKDIPFLICKKKPSPGALPHSFHRLKYFPYYLLISYALFRAQYTVNFPSVRTKRCVNGLQTGSMRKKLRVMNFQNRFYSTCIFNAAHTIKNRRVSLIRIPPMLFGTGGILM